MDVSIRTLALPDADLSYQVRGPLPPAGGARALLMIGQPMTSEGFTDLAAHFPDRTVVTYDPRGLGESTRRDGREDNRPQTQAEDLHALIGELGGPVEIFASSGGAVTALALVASHPEDVTVLVGHEPPLIRLLPDADVVASANDAVAAIYHDRGWGAGMAAFITMASWSGEFPEDFASQPFPDPAEFGMPTQDDGTRNDPLLSGSSAEVLEYAPDAMALRAASTRIVIGVGEESAGILTGRTAEAVAQLLGRDTVVFPGDHGGFHAGDPSHPGDPEAFAARLRGVLAGAR